MKKHTYTLVVSLLLSLAVFAQTDVQTTKELHLTVPSPVAQVPFANISANIPGSRTLYYWIVSKTAAGSSAPSLVGFVSAPAALNTSQYVKLTWTPLIGVASYDVLRTTSTVAPSGTCICAVATGLAGTYVSNTSDTLAAYTVSTYGTDAVLTNDGYGGVQFQALNGGVFADKFSGADASAKINAAIAALPANGGIVYATGFGNTVQTISQPINIGSTLKVVTLVMDAQQTKWNITATGGVDVFRIGDGSTLWFYGSTISNVLTVPTVHVAATANIRAVVAPANRDGTQNTIRVIGGTIVADAGATITGAVVDVQGLFVNTVIRDVNIVSLAGAIGVQVSPGTGANGGLKIASDIVIDNVQVNCLGAANCRPLKFVTAAASQVGNVTVIGGGFQHAGSGQYEIDIDGSANTAAGLLSIFFYGQHIETRTGSLGVHVKDARNILFDGFTWSGSGAQTQQFTLEESVGSALAGIHLRDGIGCPGGNWIHNTAGSGTDIPCTLNTPLSNYEFKTYDYVVAKARRGAESLNGSYSITADADATNMLSLGWKSITQSGDFIQGLNHVGVTQFRVDKSGNVYANGGNIYGNSGAQMGLGASGVNFTVNSAAAKGSFGSIEVNNSYGTTPPALGIYSKGQVQIGVAQGTAPLIVASTTQVANLTAQYATSIAGTTTGNTASVGGSSVGAGACTSGTATLTGVANTQAIACSPQTYPGDGFDWRGYMSSANTVTVKVCNTTAGSLTPTASVYVCKSYQ